MTTDVSIDIETPSTAPTAAILQIGMAVAIDGEERPELGLDLKILTDEYDATYKGMFDINIDTMTWWARQGQEAFEAAFGVPNPHNMPDVNDDRLPLAVALSVLADEMNALPPSKHVWAKPPTFDIAIIRHAYRMTGLTPGFHFREERCLNTLLNMTPYDASIHGRPFTGARHDAYADAVYQLKQVTGCRAKLSGK